MKRTLLAAWKLVRSIDWVAVSILAPLWLLAGLLAAAANGQL